MDLIIKCLNREGKVLLEKGKSGLSSGEEVIKATQEFVDNSLLDLRDNNDELEYISVKVSKILNGDEYIIADELLVKSIDQETNNKIFFPLSISLVNAITMPMTMSTARWKAIKMGLTGPGPQAPSNNSGIIL